MARPKVKLAVQYKEVSVIIPVHNEEETLNQCLASIRKQKVNEIIIVLDKCEDDSEKIAKKHAKLDPRIKIFPLSRHKFKTNYVAETVNFGFSKASNDVILTAEADTALSHNYVSTLLPHLKRPVVSVAGRFIPLHKRQLHFHETITGTGRLLFREVWEEVGGFQDILSCDTFFDLELMKRLYETKVLDEVAVYDLRNYSIRQLTIRAIRRGKGRRHNAQSLIFMLGHGLYYLTKTPFGIMELLGNTAGYLTANKRTSRENMKRYEIKRIREILGKLTRH